MSSKKFKALDGIITSGELQVDGNFSVGGSLTLGQQGTTTTQAVRADRSVTGGTDLSGGGDLTQNRVINHADISRTNTTSSQTLSSGSQFTSIVSVSSNARGHITGVNTRTYTLPVTTFDIFKNVNNTANSTQFSADGPNDGIQFAGGGATSVSFNASTKRITYSTTIGNGTLTLGTSGIATGSQTFTANSSVNRSFTVNVPGTNLSTTATATTRNVNSSTGTNVTLPAATTSAAGVMTAADRDKLNGIAPDAQVGTVTSVGSGNGLGGGPITTSGTLSVGQGNGITVSNTAVAVNAGTGLIANSTGVHVGAGNGLIANTTAISVNGGAGIFANSTGTHVSIGIGLGFSGSSVRVATISGGGIVANSSGTHVDATVVRTNGNQTIGGTKTFTSQPTVPSLRLGTAANKATISYTTNTARTFTLPAVNGNRTFAFINQAQTFTGTQTFSSTISGSINGNAATATTATTANALNTSNNYRMNSLGVGTNASGTTGEIRATNNITAFFSDERLKTFKGKIESPLEKINVLNGYHYELNELAESFGYSIDKQYVGVSAQEVESVLPELVSLAPFDTEYDENGKEYSKSGENYKTVDYSKLVALLIEGMKEQQNEIQQLKETVNHLKTIIG